MEAEHELASVEQIVPRSLDRLLLDEANHRVANEVSSSIAALRFALTAQGPRASYRMIKIAIDRLEGFGECSRILAGVTRANTDAAALVEQVCRAMLRSRVGRGPKRVKLELPPAIVDGEIARRVAMIAYELIMNALTHAFSAGGSELIVRLERIAEGLVLTIADDGPGLTRDDSSMTSGKRLGGRIVGELVQVSCGRIECEAGPSGTAIRVMLPARLQA